MFVLALTLGNTPASTSLTVKRPSGRLFSAQNLLLTFGFIALTFGLQAHVFLQVRKVRGRGVRVSCDLRLAVCVSTRYQTPPASLTCRSPGTTTWTTPQPCRAMIRTPGRMTAVRGGGKHAGVSLSTPGTASLLHF